MTTVSELVDKEKPLDVRRGPGFPVAPNTTLVAVCVSTVPTLDPEDEVREVAAVGVAKLNLDDLHANALLAPGPDGLYWTEEIKTTVYIPKYFQNRGHISELTKGSRIENVGGLESLVKTGFKTTGQIISISDSLQNTKLRLAESPGAAWDTV